MITAAVTVDKEALLYLRFIGTNGIEADIACIIDTGFSEYLTLPQDWIDALEFVYEGLDAIWLADGTQVQANLFKGKVVWDGQERAVVIHCLEGDALVGMSMMYDYLLHLPVRVNDVATLTPLS